MTEINVETLYVSSTDVKPIDIDWEDARGEDMDGFQWWDTIEYEDDGETFTLLVRNGQVEGVIIDGLQASWDDYADKWRGEQDEWDDDAIPPITEDAWDDLMQVEPYEWGAEGPMMNYWYPCPRLDEDRAKDAAVQITDLPLCVVEVNDNYGFALTGGGMDLSWDVCKAFVVTGNLPPVHFADLPSFGRGGDWWDDTVYQAMMRSLRVERDSMDYRMTRLTDLRARALGE